MTHPLGDERDALGLEDDFLTVEQVAQLRQVTPAAIRAQLRAGNLAGQQVLQGQRTVWRIPVSAARPSRDRPAGTPRTATPGPAAPPARAPETARPALLTPPS